MRIRIRTRNDILLYYVSKIDNLQFFVFFVFCSVLYIWGLPGRADGKEFVCQCRRHGLDPWVRKIPSEGNGNPLQDSCLENPTDRRATVHGVIVSWTQLSK